MKHTSKNLPLCDDVGDDEYDDIPTMTVYLKGTPLGDMLEAEGRVLREPPPGFREEQQRKIDEWHAEVAALAISPNPGKPSWKLFEAAYNHRKLKALAVEAKSAEAELPF
jgi:hypothetical protein